MRATANATGKLRKVKQILHTVLKTISKDSEKLKPRPTFTRPQIISQACIEKLNSEVLRF